jgi:hypothetical protein
MAGGVPVWHRFGRLAIALAAGALALTAAHPARADDPSPDPNWQFSAPVILVWMDNHGTLNGPVEDKAYMLVPPGVEVKGEPGHYKLADGNGGVFHYFGYDVDGPFTNARDLCPRMIAEKIKDLYAWPWYDHGIQLDECRALAGLLTPAPAPADNAGGGSGIDTSGVEPTSSDLNLAAAIIWVLLLGALGTGGVVTVRHLARPRAYSSSSPGWSQAGGGAWPATPPARQAPPPYAPPPPPGWPGPQAPASQPLTQSGNPGQQDQRPNTQTDPCAAETAALLAASVEARGIHSVLETLRALHAALQQQIVVIEQAAVPAELGVEASFLAAGAVGKVGPAWVADTLLGKLVEGIAKDELKGFIKSYFASAGQSTLGAGDAAGKAGDAALKTTLKKLISDSLSDKYFAASVAGPQNAFEFVRKWPQRWAAADKAAGSAADAIGNLLTLSKTGMSLAGLVQQSAGLRQKAMAAYGEIAELEVALETALERQRETSRDLQRCRWVHTPGAGPLPPAP